MKLSTKKITAIGMVAALYSIVTIVIGDFSYGNIQMRISEVLMLLCFYRKEYCYALSIGCFIANLFSPMPIDIVFGTLATVCAAVPMYLIGKHSSRRFSMLIVSSLFPVVTNSIIVGLELKYFMSLPFIISAVQVGLGEFLSVTVLGCILFSVVTKNKQFMRVLTELN